jgi:hypothetical protein
LAKAKGEATKLSSFIERRQLQLHSSQLKNVRSHKDDDKLYLCNDCGNYVKKKDLPQHRIDHMNEVVDGETMTIGMLDNIRHFKRHPSKCPEDLF